MTTNESSATGLSCPKCGGAMRAYERNGITIDQCTECRGIFLDRGELERLVEAEDVHYASGAASAPGRDQRYPDPAYPDPGYAEPGYLGGEHGGGKHGGYGGGKHGGYGGDPRRRRRGGFLGDLLDFG